MELVWTEQLSVGNALIDSEHQQIVHVINSVEQAFIAMDRTNLLHSLKLLLDSMRNHFRNEERIARTVGFSFDEHSLSHQYMLKKLEHVKNGLTVESETLPEGMFEHITGLLRSWLIDHVVKEDMLMKPVLKNYPYDFSPG
ncbi:MAG: hemerythrin domain-containing protein [Gallionellaceae bacterium]|jgi:hemerythrin|nr:hemerythrin domain-containing protein [Gallionellaceae bacterium]